MNLKVRSIYSFLLLAAVASCTNNQLNEPVAATPYNLEIPAGFPQPTIPADNPMTVEGVALGRMLYYDSIIHRSEAAACATCHIQERSFTSGANVLPHVNLAWSHNFLWDGAKSGSLEDVMLFEVEDFFGTDVRKLQQHSTYPALFEKAFGTKTITSKEVAYALAQFFRILNSGNSKFDQFLQGNVELTDQEYMGFDLFFTETGDCFHCHATVFFTDNLNIDNVKAERGMLMFRRQRIESLLLIAISVVFLSGRSSCKKKHSAVKPADVLCKDTGGRWDDSSCPEPGCESSRRSLNRRTCQWRYDQKQPGNSPYSCGR